MKTIFNTRILFTIFLSIALGIFTTGLFLCGKTTFAVGFCVLIGCLILTLTILCILKRYTIRKLLIIVFSVLLGATLILSCFGKTLSNVKNDKLNGMFYARVDNIMQNTSKTILQLSSIQFNNSNIDGKVNLYVFDNLDTTNVIEVGYYITFEGTLTKNNVIQNGSFNTSVFNDSVYYSGYINTDTLKIKKANATLFESIKLKAENLLNNYMQEDVAGISIALIFGDKTHIKDNLYQNFSYSGIAHILSVSGLHVGFIVAIILFLISKLSGKPKLQFLIVFIFLALYCVICNFCPSVLRASLMCLCVMLAHVFGKKQDILSSISLAGIILLLFNPFNLYDIGFQLSFASVFGIIFLSSSVTKLLLKIKLPYFIASAISITICATISTYPIVANIFGFVAPISLLSNLIILPLFSVYFALLFIVFLLTLVIPIGVLFAPLSYFFTFIILLAKIFSNFPIVLVAPLNLFVSVIYYLTIFAFTKHVNITKKYKAIICYCLVGVFLVANIFTQLPQTFNKNSITTFYNINECILITTSNNQKMLIGVGDGEDYTTNLLVREVSALNIKTLDAILLPNYDDGMQTALCVIAKAFNVQKVILPSDITNANLLGLSNNIYNNNILTKATFENYHLEQQLSIQALTYDNSVKAILIKNNGNQNLVIKGKLTQNQLDVLKQSLAGELDHIIIENYTSFVEQLKTTNTKIIDKITYQNNFWLNI